MPIHKRLFEDLKEQINSGYYKKGEAIPSENELSKVYNTTRSTVRKALESLAVAGLIEKSQGKSSVVSGTKMNIGLLTLKSISNVFPFSELQTKVVVPPYIREWPEQFGFHLSDREFKHGCLFLSRVRYVCNEPILFEEIFIPNIGVDSMLTMDLENQSVYSVLTEHFKFEITGGEQRIRAMGASQQVVQYLNVEKDNPILSVRRKLTTSDPQMNIFSVIYCNTVDFYLSENF